MDHPTETKRLCEECVELKPVEEFHLRARNGSQYRKICRLCHNKRERHRRALIRTGKQHEEISQFVLKIKNTASDRQIRVLVGAMISRFGGLQEFIQAWMEQWETARTQKPGSKKACDGFLAVIRLAQAHEASNHQAPENFDLLSTQDLEAEARRLANRLQGNS